MVKLARAFGWTPAQIRDLTAYELGAVLHELVRQEAEEQYIETYRFAFLATVLARLSGIKDVKPEDFIGQPPWEKEKARPNNDLAELIAEARAKGLQGPW